ncbi:hypothetical protein ACVME5_008093 [Bradyrhizobium liaoningense]
MQPPARNREQVAGRQREDVIERQRAHDHELVDMRRRGERRLEPGVVLQDVGDDVAMEQRRALGDTGGAAGILQERDVARRDFRLVERHAAAGRERVVEGHRPRQRPGRYHLLDPADDEIDDDPLEAEQVAHAGDDDVLHLRLRDHLLDRVGKVLQHDDGFGAGILELVLELARGVKRVDVHDRVSGAQHGGGRDGVLQYVRHHDRNTGAALEPAALQVSGERHRHLVEVTIADRLVHADERLAVGELDEALLQKVDQRCVLCRLDIGGHAGRILLEPDALHGKLPSLTRARCVTGLPHCRQYPACRNWWQAVVA